MIPANELRQEGHEGHENLFFVHSLVPFVTFVVKPLFLQSPQSEIRNPQSAIPWGIMLVMDRSFVILLHTGQGSQGEAHYDLMLEEGPALATWQLARSPEDLPPGGVAPARKLADHRREYLSYEGPVSRGRGRVERIDAGSYELLRAEEGLREVRLRGARLKGRFELRRAGGQADAWELRRLEDRDRMT
jgi:hypothetical protein